MDEQSTCPHCGRRIDGSDGGPRPMAEVRRSNTIFYCSAWHESVAFYRDRLGLEQTFENDWFVEFRLTDGSALSIADSARTTIDPAGGAGMTLSLEVADDIDALREALESKGLAPGEMIVRFGSRVFDVWDPEGHRIEFWRTDPDRPNR